MKEFNKSKFREDLVSLRGDETQDKFAKRLDISRTTLSFFENGKQVPSLDIFNRICNLGHFEPNDYFTEKHNDALIYLMGSLEETDKEKINSVMERIRIKEKYDILSRRSSNGIN